MKIDKQFSKHLLLISVLWIGFVLIIISEIYPDVPKSKLGWTLIILFGPPVYLIVEGIGEHFVGRYLGKPFDYFMNKLGVERLMTLNKILALIILFPILFIMLAFLIHMITGL
jgi:hypothetical protein